LCDGHIATPPRAAQEMRAWARDMPAAAALRQVYCKLCGMTTEDEPEGWKAEHLRPYVAHVMRIFGPDRLMFGSDWPVCMLAGSWKEVLAAFTQAIGAQPIEVREKLLGDTAAKFYGVR